MSLSSLSLSLALALSPLYLQKKDGRICSVTVHPLTERSCHLKLSTEKEYLNRVRVGVRIPGPLPLLIAGLIELVMKGK